MMEFQPKNTGFPDSVKPETVIAVVLCGETLETKPTIQAFFVRTG